MNRRSFIKAASALAISIAIPKELQLIPIPEDLKFKSVSFWVDGIHLSNVQIFDFALKEDQIQTLFNQYINDPRNLKDSAWHHVVVVENEEEEPIQRWVRRKENSDGKVWPVS